MNDALLSLLFPEPLPSLEELAARFPARTLPNGAKVVRFAPSPTGFIHVGGLFQALVDERLAHQSEGVCFLRIEDTDTVREVEGAVELILDALATYGIKFDEGPLQGGAYGPYVQSERKDIYKACAKYLVSLDKAYPCFCTSEEVDAIRAEQEKNGVRPGYYGPYAKSRTLSEEEIRASLAAGKPFVIRFKSPGDYEKKIKVQDMIRGDREFPQNDLDIVLLKSNGLPMYHFAHVVDDHTMGTTHVVRGEEWLPSLPLHIQLFQAMKWKAPKYAHTSLIQKMEGEAKRKLSKRKDPEATMSFYKEKGYPKEALLSYLLNLANSNFEDWMKANPDKSYRDFPFSVAKMNVSGALFDFQKLDNISKGVIARFSAEEVFDLARAWAAEFQPGLTGLMDEAPDYVRAILAIERTGVAKVRKDLTTWSDIYDEITYYFDRLFTQTKDEALAKLPGRSAADVKALAAEFLAVYDPADDRDAWFEKVKAAARKLGYADSVKDYAASPEKYKGNITEAAKIIRVLVTGRDQSPDLCAVMKVMGRERCARRLSVFGGA